MSGNRATPKGNNPVEMILGRCRYLIRCEGLNEESQGMDQRKP